MTTYHLQNATKIGSAYPDVALSYSSDDNTYTKRPITRTAWACSLADRPATATQLAA